MCWIQEFIFHLVVVGSLGRCLAAHFSHQPIGGPSEMSVQLSATDLQADFNLHSKGLDGAPRLGGQKGDRQ
jgi:hypothetical protein